MRRAGAYTLPHQILCAAPQGHCDCGVRWRGLQPKYCRHTTRWMEPALAPVQQWARSQRHAACACALRRSYSGFFWFTDLRARASEV